MKFSHYSRVSRVAATLALLSATSVLAQTVTGSVTGTVTDPTGAVIPGATVTVTNTQTGVASKATTNGAGVYALRFLPIGQYKVDVTANGFSSFSQPAFALEIDQTAKIDAKMSVGASTEVSVQGNLAPILDTTDGTLGLSMTSKQIETVPLNGRNFSSLTLFQPGAVNTDPTGLTGGNAIERNTFNNGIVTINGNRAQANNYTLDGIDINEGQNNLIGYNPAPDAIGEIKVVSANAPANYGNVNGGDVVSVLKSGTDTFHGSLYGYLENANLDANTWSNNFSGNKINPFTQAMFGGTFGGPIIIKKLFFFADYEGIRNHHGGTGTASVLTAAMRGGDFSALENLKDSKGNPTPIQLYNTQVAAGANGVYAPVAYANDKGVPIVNPVVRYLIANPQYYPLPNKANTDQLLQNNYIGPNKSFTNNDQGDIKIEADPRAQDKVTAFYAQSNALDQTTPVLAISFQGANQFPSKLGGGTWVHTFSPEIVNEARIGFTRVRWDQGVPADSTGNFGLKGDSLVGIPFGTQKYVGFSYQGVSNNLSGVGTPAQPQILRDNTFSYQDNLTIQRGKHLFSMGVQVQRYQENYSLSGNGGQLGSFSFSGAFTGVDGGNGYGPADWVSDLSSAQSISISSGLFGERQYRSAGFFQDDWKVMDKLTLNLGIRYEFDQPWTEAHNQTANVLLSGPLAGTVEYAGSVPASAPAGSIVCDRPSCYQPNYKQIMPRFGFAYEASPRLVIRGGYGTTSFFEGDAGNQRLSYNPPFVNFSQLSATTPGTNAGTPYKVENGFALGGVVAPGYGAWPQNIQPAYLQEFNLTTEYQLSNAMSVQLGYVGELGAHLADYRNANQLTAAQAASIAALPTGAPMPASDVAPFFNLVGQSNALLLTESEGMSNYHAAQVTVRHRETKGFEYTVNYTYSRSMTNSDGNYGGSNVAGPGGLQNGYNLGGDYGPSDQDVRHNLSAVGSYAVPFGRGKQFGGNSSGIVDLLAGGWSISGTAIVYSGLPITIFSPGNNSNTNSYNSRANQYRKLKVVNRGVGNWFGTDPSATACTTGADNGTCAYGPETANAFGTAAVGTERAPGYEQIDTSAFKDFHITESQAVGFRADAFNVFNFASYANPDNTVGDSNFGQITSTRSGPRIIQLGAHYTF